MRREWEYYITCPRKQPMDTNAYLARSGRNQSTLFVGFCLVFPPLLFLCLSHSMTSGRLLYTWGAKRGKENF